MRNGWNEIEKMIQDLTAEYQGVFVPEASDTLEVLSIAEYWKEKMKKDRDFLKMRLREKEDNITRLLQEKEAYEQRVQELDDKFKKSSALSTSIVDEANRKAEAYRITEMKLADTENVLRNIEQEMLLSEKTRQHEENIFLARIESMQKQQRTLIETLAMRDQTLLALDKDKRKAVRHYIQGMKELSRKLMIKEKEVTQSRAQAKIYFERIIAQMKDFIALVSGKMQMAGTKYKLPSSLRDMLEGVDSNIGQFSSVMDEFVIMTVDPELYYKPTDVNNYIKRNIHLVKERMRTLDISYEFHTTDILPEILIDQELMMDGIMNIIENAIEATPPQGSIIITTGKDGDGRKILVKIKNTGPCVPSAAISRVFEPYFTTKIGHQGMGLSIAKRIIELHGGNIMMSSSPKDGTVVTVIFNI